MITQVNIPITTDEYNILSCYSWPATYNVMHHGFKAKDVHKRVLVIEPDQITRLKNALVAQYKRNVTTLTHNECRGITSLLVQLKRCV